MFAVDTAAQNAAEDRGLKGKIYENRIKGQSTMHRDTVLCNLLQQAIQVKTTTSEYSEVEKECKFCLWRHCQEIQPA